MTDIKKVNLGVHGNQMNLSFDIQKATDDNQRTVVGFATMDNLDQTNEKVLAEASEEAFRLFRGNLREQHNKHSAVGRVTAFEPASYYDEQSGQTYKGIRVTARISEGAPEAWEKVKDGTYSGFSIGGAIMDSKFEIDPDTGKKSKIITKYRLTELSLVDNPANEMANFTTVYKSLDSDTLESLDKGFAAENLFWCPDHKKAAKSAHDRFTCAECGENMARVGTISENEDIASKINKVLSELEIDTEGVNTKVADEINKDAEGVEETSEAVNEVEATSETSEVEGNEVEATDSAAETEDAKAETEETVTAEAEETVEASLEDQLSTLFAEFAAKVEETLVAKVNDLESSLGEKITKAIEGAQTVLTEKLADRQSDIDSIKSNLEKVNEATAGRKSEDYVGEETIEKSNEAEDTWGGIFTSKYNLNNE